jgi:hypothetical protein
LGEEIGKKARNGSFEEALSSTSRVGCLQPLPECLSNPSEKISVYDGAIMPRTCQELLVEKNVLNYTNMLG